MYSKKAMPQLALAAIYQGLADRFFRWAYQAKVMNILDAPSNKTVFQITGMTFTPFRFLSDHFHSMEILATTLCNAPVPAIGAWASQGKKTAKDPGGNSNQEATGSPNNATSLAES